MIERPSLGEPTGSRTAASGLAFAMLVAIAVVYGGFNIGRSLVGPGWGIDFPQHYLPARFVLQGEPLLMYDTTAVYQERARAAGIPNTVTASGITMPITVNPYPPLLSYLMVPFALLPYRAAGYLFGLFSIVALAAGIFFIFAGSAPERRHVMVLVGSFAAAVFSPTLLTLQTGQATCLLVLLLALALYSARRRRDWIAGLFVALAVHVKLFPLVLLPFFLLRRQYRLVLTTLLWTAVLGGITAAAGGFELYRVFLTEVLPGQSIAGAYYRNQGFLGFFSRLFTGNEHVRSLADSPQAAMLLALAAGLAVVAITYLATRRRPEAGERDYGLGFGLCLAAAVLALPKSHEPNALVLLLCYLPAAEVLIFDEPGRRLLSSLLCLSFAVWSFLLVTETEYLKVPSAFIMQPVFSAKFLATLVAWFCGLRLLAAVRQRTGDRAVA